jgi:hypothetical protein
MYRIETPQKYCEKAPIRAKHIKTKMANMTKITPG